MVGLTTRRMGLLAVVPVVLGGVAMAQSLDQADKPGSVPAYANPTKPADLVFDNITRDFGRASDQDSLEHSFKFTNEGTGTLYITNVKGSCSCTVPALSKKEYAPGESGEIRVIFDPKSKAGQQHQTVTVTSNDAKQPMMMLNVRAYVRPEIVVEPRVGHFGEVAKDQSKELVITITGRNTEFEVLEVACSEPGGFNVEWSETLDAELAIEDYVTNAIAAATAAGGTAAATKPVEYEQVRQCKITVTMLPGQDIGLIRNKTLTITTNDVNRPTVQVELMAQHKGDLDMLPRRITLGALAPGAEFQKDVTIKSISGTPFKVLGIEHIAVVADALDFSFYPVDPANPTAYTIEVDGMMPEDTRVLRGRFLVRTDLEREEEIYLYYYAQARPVSRAQPKTTSSSEQ